MTQDDKEILKQWMMTDNSIHYKDSKKESLDELQNRWVGIIRHIGFSVIEREGENKMTKPDLFDIANEINAFFTGLKSKK